MNSDYVQYNPEEEGTLDRIYYERKKTITYRSWEHNEEEIEKKKEREYKRTKEWVMNKNTFGQSMIYKTCHLMRILSYDNDGRGVCVRACKRVFPQYSIYILFLTVFTVLVCFIFFYSIFLYYMHLSSAGSWHLWNSLQ